MGKMENIVVVRMNTGSEAQVIIGWVIMSKRCNATQE
jgi:hypothetical protein